MTDRIAIALTLYGEARGESVEGRIAVACVLRNRRQLGRWGATYAAVCLAPWQFSCWNVADPNAAMLQRLAAALEAGTDPTDPTLRECLWIADGLIAGAILPRVRGATHYYATWMKVPPAWAQVGAVRLEGTIGSHLFWSNVS